MTTNTSRKTRRRLWLGGCFVIVVLAVAVPAGALWYILETTDDGTAALRAKGYPTTIEDLEVWFPEPPPGENVADFYVEAGALLQASTFEDLALLPILGDGELPELGERFSDEALAAIGEFIEHEVTAFDLIDEATLYETGRFSANPQTATLNIKNWFTALRVQQLRAIYYFDSGHTEQAIDSIRGLLHMTYSRSSAPSIDSVMFSGIVVGWAFRVVERFISHHELSKKQLVELDSMFAALPLENGLLHAMIRDRGITLDRMMNSPSGSIPFTRELVSNSYSQMTNLYIPIAEAGFPAAIAEFRALADRPKSWINVYVHIFEPGYSNAVTRHYDTVANQSLVRLAVAIELARKDGLDLADTRMTSAVVNWPIDPFSGDPIRLKLEGNGYIVYSVGRNFSDDGGQRNQGLDTVFRVQR